MHLYAGFSRPIVGIASTHPTVQNVEKHRDFYKVIMKFLNEGGLKNHPEFDYVLMNVLDIKDVADDLQMKDLGDNQNFFLFILADGDNGYLYEGIILREEEKHQLVRTS